MAGAAYQYHLDKMKKAQIKIIPTTSRLSDLRSKRAQGMPLNVIIIAILVLIVLVVLAIIFAGKIGQFGKGTTESEKQYQATTCAVPGTGRYCGPCKEGDSEVAGSFDCTPCCYG